MNVPSKSEMSRNVNPMPIHDLIGIFVSFVIFVNNYYDFEGDFMSVKVQIVFYSMYGHIHRMSEAIAEGVREVNGAEVELFQVPELVPEEALKRTGADKKRAVFAHIPFADVHKLPEADAIIFGTPTRFGNMCAQMRNFLDQCGGIWSQGKLINKVGSVFVSTNTQHGGQETTISSFVTNLFHFGMVIVGVPFSEPGLSNTETVSGGTPYGASTVGSHDGTRYPTEGELATARFQGKHVATIAKQLTCQS